MRVMEVIRSNAFAKWLKTLPDKLAKASISRRLERLENNDNLGDFKNLGDKICEMRIHTSKGYRIYFSMVGNKLILLLIGGDKSSQQKDISKAKEILQYYLKGTK